MDYRHPIGLHTCLWSVSYTIQLLIHAHFE
uniref:Uncharacterized protein n=1 Tax=Anguilla anguilla TaxID=7936 RepID=A0A0E9W9N1_ANGAN